MVLALALSATPAGAATLLTMSGSVTFEDYGPNPSPFEAPADNVAISVLFDDTIAPNGDLSIGDTEIAFYNTAILATTIDIFNMGGGILSSIDLPDAWISIGYQPSTGNSEMTLWSTFFPSPESPFVELDVTFFSDNMFNGVSLEQITEGRLQFADLLSAGDLETELGTFDIDGIGFDIDLGSLSVTRDVPAPTPVPAPPAILALLTGVFGLGFLSRRRYRRCTAMPGATVT